MCPRYCSRMGGHSKEEVVHIFGGAVQCGQRMEVRDGDGVIDACSTHRELLKFRNCSIAVLDAFVGTRQ